MVWVTRIKLSQCKVLSKSSWNLYYAHILSMPSSFDLCGHNCCRQVLSIVTFACDCNFDCNFAVTISVSSSVLNLIKQPQKCTKCLYLKITNAKSFLIVIALWATELHLVTGITEWEKKIKTDNSLFTITKLYSMMNSKVMMKLWWKWWSWPDSVTIL